jgi:Flp pilus assembly protein protease CpaA
MMDLPAINLLMFATALGFSSVASYFDLKTGEIPDKFTIGLVVVALAMRAGFSAYLGNFTYLLDGALVGGILFAFGALLFYTGGWGGGDAKLMAGIGAALGGLLAPTIIDSGFAALPPFFGFFIALSIVAIPYSLGYALILSIRKPRVFSDTVDKLRENWFSLAMVLIASLAFFIVFRPTAAILIFLSLLPAVFYLVLMFSKSVEEVAMQKEIPVGDLQEGDMVVEDVHVRGERVASKRDMDGLSKESLGKIRKSNLRKIKIKWGIRFAPAFPLAIVISPFWTGIMLLIV